MKIAFFSTMKGIPWGGSEELWAAACVRAVSAGHEVLASVWQRPEVHPKLVPIRGSVARWAPRPMRDSKLKRLFVAPGWVNELDSFGPDMVCLSQGGAYECAGHRSMIPLLKWLSRSDAALVNLIQFNSPDSSLGRSAAARARWLYERAAVNAFVAEDNAQEASRRLGIAIPRAVVVRNPVNLRDTTPIPWPEGPVARFATVARLDAKTKGQDLIFGALAGPGWASREWTLSLFGEGPDEARFKAMIGSLGLSSRVEFRGHADDVRGIWVSHHALVMPSRAEGTPLAMVEAMILGRPVVVCDRGGCADWVDDGVEGFRAPKPSPGDVAAALERAWIARPRWREIGSAARDRARRLLGPDPGADFLEVLEKAGSARIRPAASLALDS